MAPRLLTLLNHIETAFSNRGSPSVSVPPLRTINFHKGMARMTFADGSGSILLQNFTLADGEICVRAVFSWGDSASTGSHSIYPRELFDWPAAADQIAGAWINGQSAAMAALVAPEMTAHETAGPSMEPVAATG
jgi:hypothetical protein